ncbi:MAG TPA: tetratricopeptide repeat protein [Gemmatimonadales bacterium]|nr:tetratricopeptide repeat protein [Gemmatimonadales bacterium]
MPEERPPDLVGQLALARQRERTLPLPEARAVYDELVVAATRESNPAVLAEALRRRAILSHQASDDATARAGLQQSYAVARLLADSALAAEALNTLGGLELETGNLVAAEAALTEALGLAAHRPDLTARIAQNLGIVANIRGDHAAAERHYTRSLAAYVELGDDHGCALAHHNLGMVMADRERWEEANAHYAQALALARAQGDAHLAALCLVNHTEALLATGDLGAARTAAEAARGTFLALAARFDLADAERVLALVERAEGAALPVVEDRLRGAMALARETGARLTEAEAARELGRLYLERGRPADARRHLAEAHQIFSHIGAAVDAADVATLLAATPA